MDLALLYCLLCLGLIVCNTIERKKLFNALNIYLLIWAMMVLLYNLKWILYYDLTSTTWIMIYLSTISVFVGNLFGVHKAKKHIQKCNTISAADIDLISKKRLINSILITSLIAAFAIIPNIFFLMEKYGLNILSKTSEIYYDNLNGKAPLSIPYLGAIIYVSDILAGIYFSRYGYKSFILLPIILSMLSILPSGSRGWLILAVFMFIFPYFIMPSFQKANKKATRKNRFKLAILIMVVCMLFIILTINRSKNLDPQILQFMSPEMKIFAQKMPSVYKLYQYFASPIGVLNEFLKCPDFYFGKNTFAVLYNFLDKFGFDVNYSRYQTFYSIPIRTNVGTWVLELIQDFGIWGMFIVIISFAFTVGYFEQMSNVCLARKYILWSTVFNTIFVMSFFVWYLREGTMIIIILTVALMNLVNKSKYNRVRRLIAPEIAKL